MEKAKGASEFLPEFIAVVFLAWPIESHSFSDLRSILDPFFN